MINIRNVGDAWEMVVLGKKRATNEGKKQRKQRIYTANVLPLSIIHIAFIICLEYG